MLQAAAPPAVVDDSVLHLSGPTAAIQLASVIFHCRFEFDLDDAAIAGSPLSKRRLYLLRPSS